MKPPPPPTTDPRLQRGVLAVRQGPSANCSSIGSVVDTLFLTAVAGGALFTAIAAAVAAEKNDIRLVGQEPASPSSTKPKDEGQDDAPAP